MTTQSPGSGGANKLEMKAQDLQRQLDEFRRRDAEKDAQVRALSQLIGSLGELSALPPTIRSDLNAFQQRATKKTEHVQQLKNDEPREPERQALAQSSTSWCPKESADAISPRSEGSVASDDRSADGPDSPGSSDEPEDVLVSTHTWEYPLTKAEQQARLNLLSDWMGRAAEHGERVKEREIKRLEKENRKLRRSSLSMISTVSEALSSDSKACEGDGQGQSAASSSGAQSSDEEFVVQANRLADALMRVNPNDPTVELPTRWNNNLAGEKIILAIEDEDLRKRASNVWTEIWNAITFTDPDAEECSA